VSAPTGAAGAEFQDIAKKIAGADSLDAFLRDMRTRYPDSSAISPDGNKAPPPAAAPAAPPGPASNTAAPDKTSGNAPAKPDSAASPLPPNGPAEAPRKPDPSPTGSISRR